MTSQDRIEDAITALERIASAVEALLELSKDIRDANIRAADALEAAGYTRKVCQW